MTQSIHDSLQSILNDPKGLAVSITATHNCVQCRGVKHVGTSMGTTVLSGAFKENPETRSEFDNYINRHLLQKR